MSSMVVVVEDDPDILELVCEVLEAEGFAVVALATPDVERIHAIAPRPAALLLDLMLPGMSGVDLAAQLRATSLPDTPLIAMSASRLMLEVARGSGCFQELLAKPFNLSALLKAVERCATGRRGFQDRILS